MQKIIFAMLVSALFSPALADGEFAEGSQVDGWKNLSGREQALFEAKVVDVVCALGGDCPKDCGAGQRTMALLRQADDKLILAGKNAQAAFNGANVDLQNYCGQTVMVDGLLVGNPDLTSTKYYQVFLIKGPDDTDWVKANTWTKKWKEDHPDLANAKGPWFRHDPAIAAQIAEQGYLGLGLEEDKKYIEENY